MTRAPLEDRLDALAIQFSETAWNEDMSEQQLRAYLRDHAYSLCEFAEQVRDEYVRADAEGKVPTNAQGIAIARVIRGRWAGDIDYNVTVGREMSFDGGKSPRIGFHFVDGFTGGIAPDGSVNT
jgi:hypothetical protein